MPLLQLDGMDEPLFKQLLSVAILRLFRGSWLQEQMLMHPLQLDGMDEPLFKQLLDVATCLWLRDC